MSTFFTSKGGGGAGARPLKYDPAFQGSGIRSVRILFSERYVRTITYSILAYVNKNRIRKQTMIAEAAN